MNADPSAAPPNARLRIGVTGHRIPPKLPEESEAPLRAQMDRIFTAFASATRNIENTYMAHMSAREAAMVRETVVVSSLAEGSDRIVAEAGLAGGCKLEVVLPLNRAEYTKDFETAKSREKFDGLLARASKVVDLDGSPTERPRAYEAAGLFMLDNIDVLITIWDGEVAAGIGGTAQIVERAIADGIMVLWIEPTHPHSIQISHFGAAKLFATGRATTPSSRHFILRTKQPSRKLFSKFLSLKFRQGRREPQAAETRRLPVLKTLATITFLDPVPSACWRSTAAAFAAHSPSLFWSASSPC